VTLPAFGPAAPDLDRLLGRCTFDLVPGPLSCAVSGGADSLALLALAAATGRPVTAIHVDHGLRTGSGAEAEVVARAAQRFGAEFRALSVAVTPGGNLEERARRARLAQLPEGALTGHTMDDQAETVLINLLRGAGVEGLAGMRPAGRPLGHPLLGLRRAETHGLCAALGLEPVTDPTNHDPSWVRNRIRYEVLPLLAQVSGRDPVPILARQAGLLAEDADLLAELAGAVDPEDAGALRQARAPLARRAVRRWLAGADADGHPPNSDTVDRVLAVARLEAVACQVPGGDQVRRRAGRLRRVAGAGDAPPTDNAPPAG
jgi:tRNA(Ile)-lysidine synthase